MLPPGGPDGPNGRYHADRAAPPMGGVRTLGSVHNNAQDVVMNKVVMGRRSWIVAAVWACAGGALAQPVQPVLRGAGATLPADIYARWAEAYRAQTGVALAYDRVGSGQGVQRMVARQVQFGATDSPLSADELRQHRLIQMPTVAAAVVPVVQLRALRGRALRVSGEVLADIYLGRVTMWNDRRLAALNPGLGLPELPIRRIVRSDRSGTTHAFSRYLSAVSADFKATAGESQLPKWPGEPLAAEGNGGVAKLLRQTEGGIAFVGYDLALKESLHLLTLPDATGHWVNASEVSIQTAIRASDVHREGDDLARTLLMPKRGAWPITVVTFVLFDAEPARAADVQAAMRFFYWAFMEGDRLVQGTGFAALPVMLQARLASRLMSVRPRDGSVPAVF